MRSLFDYGDVCNLLFKIFFFLSARDAKVLGKGIFKGPKDKYGSRSKQSQGLVGLRYDLFNSKVIIISLRDTTSTRPFLHFGAPASFSLCTHDVADICSHPLQL